jgi:23S rRNA pseudouridine2605 synthase
MVERLQKILARAGYGSRRFCESLIAEGRVKVNGQVAQLGEKADISKDHITVDEIKIDKTERLVYIMLHKPRGVISTVSAPDTRKTVRDMVDIPEKIYPVGRLDVDSEGLILMTNDGELANQLTHPSFKHEKEYRVQVSKRPDHKQISTWRRGIVLDDGYRTKPAIVQIEKTTGKGAWLTIVLKEGRKRQIRECGARIGLPVNRIIRTRVGNLLLGNLKLGEWRYLTSDEINTIRKQKK